MKKTLTTIGLISLVVLFMTINIAGAALIDSRRVSDTVIVVKLSDYRRINQIVYEATHGANDAQKTLWAIDLNRINSRVKQQIDTLKK
jgi:hypothetical protein